MKVGSRFITSKEARARFVAATTAVPGDAPGPRSPADRRRAAERVGAELDQLLGAGGAVPVA